MGGPRSVSEIFERDFPTGVRYSTFLSDENLKFC
jgi:hypothetical protein